MLLVACFALQGCLFSSGGKGASEGKSVGKEHPPVNRGYYTINHSAADSRLNLDSTYTLQWQASDSTGQGPVWIFLYRNETRLGLLLGSLKGTDTLDWDLSNMHFFGGNPLGSGSDYRLRIVSDADSSRWDFSPRFTLYSDYPGSLKLTAPIPGAQIMGDSTLRIEWTLTGEVGEFVGLRLYRDTTLVWTIPISVPAAENGYSWSDIPEWFPSGDQYRIRIFSMSDGSIGEMGPAFTLNVPELNGSYEFLRPRSGESWVAGELVTLEWIVTGNPGSLSGLTLWRDSPRELIMGWTPGDTYHPPTQIRAPTDIASGTYRLRIGSLVDTSLFAFSPAFTLEGR